MNKNQQQIEQYLNLLNSLRRTPATQGNVKEILTGLSKHINKGFAEATPSDLQTYFEGLSFNTVNMRAVIIIRFYVWLLKLKKNQRPKCMAWFEYIKQERIDKEANPDAKYKFITETEYSQILEASKDKYGVYEALWEVFYLSGGRCQEVTRMLVGDVKMDGGNVTVVLRNSKTRPREVPLCQTPHLLLRWLGNHPQRNDPNAPLWLDMTHHKLLKPLMEKTIQNRFWQIRKETGIKPDLTIHCFRKTRATLMFNETSVDGGLIYSDSHMAKFFGWKPHTVVERRLQYDLTNQEDLKKRVFAKNAKPTIPTYDVIKQEKEALESSYKKKMDDLQEQMDKLAEMMDAIQKKEAYDAYKSEQREFEESIKK